MLFTCLFLSIPVVFAQSSGGLLDAISINDSDEVATSERNSKRCAVYADTPSEEIERPKNELGFRF